MLTELYNQYERTLKEIAFLRSANQLLQWDLETMCPEDARDFKGEQLAFFAGLIQEKYTDPVLVGTINKLYENRESFEFEQRRNIEESYKDTQNSLKLSKEFVENINKAISNAYNGWRSAKSKNDFSLFAPHLEKLIELKKEEAQLLSVGENYDCLYDAMLNQYEPGCTSKELDVVFGDLKMWLIPLIGKLKTQSLDNPLSSTELEEQKQWNLLKEVAQDLNFDFRKGRIDASLHPFSVGIHPTDSRITSRYKTDDPLELIWSGIHEVGHSLYEQGLNPKYFGLPQGESVSLGIHESQSRFWENNIGRSLAYCKRILPLFKKFFPHQFKGFIPEDLFKTLNIVSPGLVRTSADEVTYHLHIIIRYEIEKAIINGEVKIDWLPQLWNQKYYEYLGLSPESDSKGILQDIHWAHGSFGYFPTYSLGSLYAAQFMQKIKSEIPGFENSIAYGSLNAILNWMRVNIHVQGRLYTASQLCENATGEKLNAVHFKNYILQKLSLIYDIDNE